MKNLINSLLVLVGAGTLFLTFNTRDYPQHDVLEISAGSLKTDTIYCGDPFFFINRGPKDYPKMDTFIYNVSTFGSCNSPWKIGKNIETPCGIDSVRSLLGSSCNHYFPGVDCFMQGKNFYLVSRPQTSTIVDSISLHYALVKKSTMSQPQDSPNLAKKMQIEFYKNGIFEESWVQDLPIYATADSFFWVKFYLHKTLTPGNEYHFFISGIDPFYTHNPKNVPIWEIKEGIRINYICAGLGNICSWNSEKISEDFSVCPALATYRYTSSCGPTETICFVIVDNDPPVVLNKPQDVTITLPTNGCEMEYFVPPIVFDDCDKNASVFIHTDYGDIRGNGGYLFGIRVDIKRFLVTYTITDGCGNSSQCSYFVNVKEDNSFNIVCEKAINTSLNADSCSRVYAESFFVDMVGLCCGYTLTVKRLDTGKEGKYVELCCSDVGKTIQVCLQGRSKCDTNQIAQCFSTITLQDKSTPRITCPKDFTVDCAVFDISKIDTPKVKSSCGYKLTMSQVNNINSLCKAGQILRTWIATASSGNTATCTQIITVVNSHPISASDIIWPRDTILYGCNSNYKDSTLTGLPRVIYKGCSRAGSISMNDMYFGTYSDGFCAKVLRTWTICDDCNNNQKFMYTQKIILKDSTKPVFTFCPADTSFGNLGACTDSVKIILKPALATDCSKVKITNNSPYADSSGANASGKYPNGNHRVVFTATDFCGTTSTCSMTITVSDKKAPSLILINGLSTDVQDCPPMGVGAKVILEKFIKSFSDNCCKKEDIKLSFFKDTIITELWYPCDSIGWRELTIYAFDCYGNYIFVKTKIDIQDNFKLCPPTFKDTLMVAGALTRPNGKEVEFVEMNLDTQKIVCTGFYKFDSLAPKTHKVVPWKDDDPMEGVSTKDIVKIQRYILGRDTFFTPYQLIAADVNNDKKITNADISEIRKLILGIIPKFTNNTSWRFVPKAHNFPISVMDWNFPEFLNVDHGIPPIDIMNADFYGIKIGDVDGNANTLTNEDEDLYLSSDEKKWLDELDAFLFMEEVARIAEHTKEAVLKAIGQTIYPNPTTGQLFVEISPEYDNGLLTIISTKGQKIQTFTVKAGKFELSIENYQKGYYIVMLQKDKIQTSMKVLKL